MHAKPGLKIQGPTFVESLVGVLVRRLDGRPIDRLILKHSNLNNLKLCTFNLLNLLEITLTTPFVCG